MISYLSLYLSHPRSDWLSLVSAGCGIVDHSALQLIVVDILQGISK